VSDPNADNSHNAPTPAAARADRTQRMLLIALATVSLLMTGMIVFTVAYREAGEMTQSDIAGSLRAIADDELQPPVLYPLPPFQLIERSEAIVTNDTLAGRVWIADFIFRRCEGPCPAMTSQMARMQMDLEHHPQWDQIRLVSFTVDPEYDTPAVLREYAQMALADPVHWLFLTGTREQIWSLAREGFKLPVGEAPENPEMPIFHSQKFVLVDHNGHVRGYYDGLDETERGQLMADLERVLAEQPAPAADQE